MKWAHLRHGRELVVLGMIGLLLGLIGPAKADSFRDDDGEFYEPAIDALAQRGVFDGTECGEGLVCPDEVIERWVMAVWMVRVLEDTELGAVSSARFTDVDIDEWWAPYVDRLAELEVTKGCAVEPPEFCPDEPVTRGQMATFLARAFDLGSVSPAGFVDVEGNVHAENIDALANARITQGCATEPARFCPDEPVTRGQMATFLARAIGLVPLPPTVRSATSTEIFRGLPLDPRPAEVAMGFNACCADIAYWQIPVELGWWDDLNITIVPNSPTYYFFTASADAVAWLRSGEGNVAPGWVPGLFGALETFAQDIPPIHFADTYLGYMILVAPDSDSKTALEFMEEGMSFPEAATTAVRQLVGATVHIPPHSTAQAQYANAFFAYLPEWWLNPDNPRWTYLTNEEGLPHVVMNRDGTPRLDQGGNPQPIRITTNDWRYYALPAFRDDRSIVRLAEVPGRIEYAMPLGAPTMVQMIRNGWDPLINFAMMFEHDPASLQTAIASRTVGGTGLLANRQWVEENKDLAFRIISVAYRTFAFLKHPETRNQGWEIIANIINEKRILSLEPEDIGIILTTIDPLFTWEDQEAVWDQTLPGYHPETVFRGQIETLKARGVLSPTYNTQAGVEKFLLAQDFYYEMKDMQERSDDLFTKALGMNLSENQEELVEQAHVFYARYNFYDALRYLEEALAR